MAGRLVTVASLAASAAALTVPANNFTLQNRACQHSFAGLPFCNSSLSIEERAWDIANRVNISDAPVQLTARLCGGGSPCANHTLPYLGVPAYDFGLNCLHGVQSSCVSFSGQVYCPTSFPAPVNFGMTWNASLGGAMGAIIATEARALWLAGATEESSWSGYPPIGLDCWSPNINIARDPRWGRNSETPSEDPLLNGDYVVAHVKGMQEGEDPNHVKVVTVIKHFAAYSLENSDGFTRYNFNAVVSNYALATTYLPAFRRAVIDARAKGLMTSYNALNGVPTSASDFLAQTLREAWGFDGFTTSDTGAVADIYTEHKYVSTAAKAACVAIRNGSTDINSDVVYMQALLQGVQQGDCSESDVRQALYHVFRMRMQLGLFDSPEDSPYWSIPLSVVNTAESKATAWLATLSSMVLLKLDAKTLPLSPGRKIAVVGPHWNASSALLASYLGQICPDDTYDCVQGVVDAIAAANKGGSTSGAGGCANVQCNSTSGFGAALALAKAADAVVLMLGIDGTVEAETLDRTSIGLPGNQALLAQQVAALGKPTVAVLINGGAIDVSPLLSNANVGAVLEAGYPGVQGAAGIAATLFGQNTHLGGKLPYTIYPSSYVSAIPMSQMEVDQGPGRSYRYYTGETVLPFGYGLSLSTFSLCLVSSPGDNATLSTGVAPNLSLSYAVKIANTGGVEGDEVLQVYMRPVSTPSQPSSRLLRQLVFYQRVHLLPGESTQVTFTASSATLQMVDHSSGNTVSTPGYFQLQFTDGVSQVISQGVLVQGPEVVVFNFPDGTRR